MLTFTLDNNCIIYLEHGAEPKLDALLAAHRAGQADVAILGISASEQGKGGVWAESFHSFREAVNDIRIGDLTILKPMGYYDVSYWDWAVYASDEMKELEGRIFSILFPGQFASWPAFAASHSVEVDDKSPAVYGKWRNRLCDVQSFWSHTWHKRNVFVTNDGNFHKVTKRPGLEALSGGQILRPSELP